MAWVNLRAELDEEFHERHDVFMELTRRKSARQKYPSKIWWCQKRTSRRLLARSNRTCRNAFCRKTFTGKRSDEAYCSPACRSRERSRNYQRRKALAKRTTPSVLA
jgi:hypothetical protein